MQARTPTSCRHSTESALFCRWAWGLNRRKHENEGIFGVPSPFTLDENLFQSAIATVPAVRSHISGTVLEALRGCDQPLRGSPESAERYLWS
jgi:hypothetical protein